MPFIANLPHTGKQYDCVILSKSGSIGCYTHTHNMNPNHHNCARPALKQALLITDKINSICRPQQPFLGRSNESSIIYIRTQLAIATAKRLIKKNEIKHSYLYVRARLAIATTERMNLERLELIYCIINEQGKTIINTTKVITTIELSRTHYKGNSVICTIVDECSIPRNECN